MASFTVTVGDLDNGWINSCLLVKALRSGRKLRAMLCGYYGEHNLGDDALLQVLVSQIPSDWELVVTARDSEAVFTSSFCCGVPVSSVYRYCCGVRGWVHFNIG